MFVIGLVLGPVLGLVVGDWLLRSGRVDSRVGTIALALVLLVFLASGLSSIELRLGLVAGCFLGLLLAATPFTSFTTD